MTRFTAVVAAVAALGMATTSWGFTYNQQDSETILIQGETLGAIDNYLLVKFGDNLFVCGLVHYTTHFQPYCVDSREP